MNRDPIETDTIHHVYNRGVDKRVVFLDDEDRQRFVSYLRWLNDVDIENVRPANILAHATRHDQMNTKSRPLVSIIAFALMDNHYHLLLEQKVDGGISKFMQRLGTAYTMYFNEKMERSGSLFQGVFKSKYIHDDAYLDQIIRYIHMNPLDMIDPDWEEKSIKDRSRAVEFLASYPWSSFVDVCGENKYAKVVDQKRLLELVGDYRTHRNIVQDWMPTKEFSF